MEGRKVGYLSQYKITSENSETTPTNNFVRNLDTCWIQRLCIILVLLFIMLVFLASAYNNKEV